MVFVHRSHCYLFTPPHLFQQFPQIPDQISQFPLGPVSRLPEILPGNLTDLFQMLCHRIPVKETFCCHFLNIAVFFEINFQDLQVFTSCLLVDPLQLSQGLCLIFP